MNLDHLHRDLGRLEGQVTALQEKVNSMDEKLDAALAHINRTKGVSFAVGAGTSAVVAFATAWFAR
jgi:D-arabinose 5-phosphate isomerase GutQ